MKKKFTSIFNGSFHFITWEGFDIKAPNIERDAAWFALCEHTSSTDPIWDILGRAKSASGTATFVMNEKGSFKISSVELETVGDQVERQKRRGMFDNSRVWTGGMGDTSHKESVGSQD